MTPEQIHITIAHLEAVIRSLYTGQYQPAQARLANLKERAALKAAVKYLKSLLPAS